jgi:hypothetical protein
MGKQRNPCPLHNSHAHCGYEARIRADQESETTHKIINRLRIALRDSFSLMVDRKGGMSPEYRHLVTRLMDQIRQLALEQEKKDARRGEIYPTIHPGE